MRKIAWQHAAFVVFCAMCHPCSSMAAAPDRALSQYVSNRWDARDGLPQNSIHYLAQTKGGFIWAGTQEGLARFDGFGFQVFNRTNTEILTSNEVTCLQPGRDGGLWVGFSRGGVLYWRDGRFTRPLSDEKLQTSTVLCLLETESGVIYLGTKSLGMFSVENGATERIAGPFGAGGVTALAEWPGKGLLLGTEGEGLLLYQDGVFQQMYLATTDSAKFITDIASFPEGGFLVATQGAGLFLVDRSGVQLLAFDPDEPNLNQISRVAAKSNGEIWWGTHLGVSRKFGERIEHFSVGTRTRAHIVYSLMLDESEQLWIGVAGLGLNRYALGSVIPYTRREGLCDDMVWMVQNMPSGGILTGTDSSGLCLIQNGEPTQHGIPEALTKGIINSASYDSEGRLWVGTTRGLYRVADGQAEIIGEGEEAYKGNVFPVYCDRRDRVWFGSDAGLFVLDGDRLKAMDQESLNPAAFQAIVEDEKGRVWIGASEGLVRFDDVDVEVFRQRGSAFDPQQISAILPDGDGLWISHYTRGLGWFQDGEFQYFDGAGLLPECPYSLLSDDFGNLWYSSNVGLFRVEKMELRAFLRGELKRVNWQKFGTPDGLASAECNLGGIPAAIKDDRGWLWFSTAIGAVMVDPANIPPTLPPPEVYISTVKVDGKVLPHSEITRLPGQFRALDISFGAVEFFDPSGIEFQTRLSSLPESGTMEAPRRVAHFTQLPPGKMTFSVAAGNSTRGFKTAELELHVPATSSYLWYRRLLFGGIFLAAMLALYLIFKWRMTYRNYQNMQARLGELKAKQSTKRALLDRTTQRLAIANEVIEEVELGSHLLHNVGNVLNSISVSSGMVEKMLRRSGVAELLRKILNVIGEHRNDFRQYLKNDGQGARLPSAMGEIAEVVVDGNEDLFAEMANLQLQCGHVQDIVKGMETKGEGLESVKLHLLVEDALKIQGHLITKYHIEVDRDLSGNYEVVCHRSKLLQILVNIIRNAIEAMILVDQDQTRKMTFQVEIDEEGMVLLDIADNGVGIDDKDLDRLFLHGFTTKKHGYGFGLSFCKTMMQEMHGDVDVMSAGKGKGATFRLILMRKKS